MINYIYVIDYGINSLTLTVLDILMFEATSVL